MNEKKRLLGRNGASGQSCFSHVGVWKSTELGVGMVLVAAEAAEHGQEVVCAKLDIDNCYVHAEHYQGALVVRVRCRLQCAPVARSRLAAPVDRHPMLDACVASLLVKVGLAVCVDVATMQVVPNRQENFRLPHPRTRFGPFFFLVTLLLLICESTFQSTCFCRLDGSKEI